MRREAPSPFAAPGHPLTLSTPLGSPQARVPGSPGAPGPMGCWSPSRNLISLHKCGVTQTPDPNKALDARGKQAASIIQQLL